MKISLHCQPGHHRSRSLSDEMTRLRTSAFVFVVMSVLISWAESPKIAGAQAAPVPPAYVLVDHDTGKVLAANNERTPLPPASITKLLTALVATQQLSSEGSVSISEKQRRCLR